MWVIYRVLGFRRAHPGVFSEGEYLPVAVDGPMLAYARRSGSNWVLVLAPLIRRTELETPSGFRLELPAGAPGPWMDLFTGDVYQTDDGAPVWKGWNRFPVAMLVSR